MTKQQQADYLVKKLGKEKALENVNNTINVWRLKEKYEPTQKGLDVCNETIGFWTGVKYLIQPNVNVS